MADDLNQTLVQLMQSGLVESATLTVVLKPRPSPPPTDPAITVCTIDFGPVSQKE